MPRALLLSLLVLAAGCPPPPVEAHEAAAQLRDNPHRIGTVSRQELASDVTDPDSTVGRASRPAPVSSTLSVKIIGMVQSKLCFLVEDTAFETDETPVDQKAAYNVRMQRASWAAVAFPAKWLDKPIPWPTPAASVMVKTNDAKDSRAIDAAVCVPAPGLGAEARLLALAISWGREERQLALWELTE